MDTSKRILIVLLCLLAQACATTEPASPQAVAVAVDRPSFGDGSRFGLRPQIQTPEQLHQLTAQQEADFLAWFHDPARAGVDAHRRLSDYLENITIGFHYQGDTLIAREALARNSGNCLSLAILTTALAHVAGIRVAYQLMDDQPVFEYQGSVVRKGVHLSTIVYNPVTQADAGAGYSRRSYALKIDYFPSLKGRLIANLSPEEYLAMYYNNIASDAITAGDYRTAYWYLQEALRHVPDQGAALNMLAVVNRRAGDVATAEAIYRYGIAHAQDKLSLLKNYHALLVVLGRNREAQQVQRQLDMLDDPSPYHWLQLARASHAAGAWNEAIRYYQRALVLAPNLHEALLGLAQSYYATGRLRSAENALRDAALYAERVSTRTLYEAKLATLRQEF
jgi:Tfp pilus assembly protein PilF